MTRLSEIELMLNSLIPVDMQSDNLVTMDMLKIGVVDTCSSIGVNDLLFEPVTETDEEGNEQVIDYIITPDLTLAQQRLASYYSYILYLEKLKLVLNNDAINFSTLTFSIKGLEKRPEAINDMIYTAKRYLSDYQDRLTGSDAILGNATQFGSSSGGDYYG